MADKLRFSFLMRPREAEALKRIAECMDRSQGATLRTLIRKADRELVNAGQLPADPPTSVSDELSREVVTHGNG